MLGMREEQFTERGSSFNGKEKWGDPRMLGPGMACEQGRELRQESPAGWKRELDLSCCDTLPKEVNLKEEAFILAHGFSPWFIALILSLWCIDHWEGHGRRTCSPHGNQEEGASMCAHVFTRSRARAKGTETRYNLQSHFPHDTLPSPRP